VAGRYQLEHELGRGGMGVVWRAVDTLIERTVALKELRPPVGEESASFVERALREARNAGRLNHPGVVGVHDVIAPTDDHDSVFIVMEYVEAPSLAEVIDRQGSLPPARVAAIGKAILDALLAAHALGIVHRDIKPANVLVKDGDGVKLTDFGIALADEDTRLTRTGVMGTHAYLAPECFDAGQVGPATDLWALGATLFHAVAGQPPFERPTTTATLRAILFEEPPPVPCPPPLADVIRGLLTRAVDQRLTGSAARNLLQQASSSAPTIDAPPTPGPDRGGWQAQSTTHHRAPTPPPPPPPAPHPHTTLPGGPPLGYATGPQVPPPSPAYASGPGRTAKRSPILGLVGAAAVLLVGGFIIAIGRGGDDGGGSDDQQATTVPPALDIPAGDDIEVPGPSDSGSDTTATDPGTGGSGTGSAQETATALIAAVNSGDESSALDMLCTESHNQSDVSEAVAGGASLTIDEATADTGGLGYTASVNGTAAGEELTAGYISVYPYTGGPGWCVYMFYAM
jgi:serine/threonine protein kinase